MADPIHDKILIVDFDGKPKNPDVRINPTMAAHGPVYRENPTARLLSDGMAHTYLDVEGTSATVLVVRQGSKPKPHGGAV